MVKSNNREDDDWINKNDIIYLRESNNCIDIFFIVFDIIKEEL